jgi:hypothetical protein
VRIFLALTALALAACQVSSNEPANSEAGANDSATATPAAAAPAPASPTAPPADSVRPTPDSEKSAEAAAAVLQRYFDAVATRRYGDAYRMWSGNGEATGMSEPEFAASFAKYRVYDGHAGKPGLTDGAAGSIYIEIPAQVTGVLAKGGGFVLEGRITLKRVNDVDGSTVEQRRWHIQACGLKPRP